LCAFIATGQQDNYRCAMSGNTLDNLDRDQSAAQKYHHELALRHQGCLLTNGEYGR